MDTYPHLVIRREEPMPERRTRRRPFFKVDDPAAHGQALQQQLSHATEVSDQNLGGYDQRRLFRFEVQKGFDPDDLRKISDEIEFVSQEADEVVIAFVSETALASFEAKLASLAEGQHVTYKQILYALRGFDSWTPEKRKGWALQQHGFPDEESFFLDIELWPLEGRAEDRVRLSTAFESWLNQQGLQYLDRVIQLGLILYRVRCNHDQAELLLRHRDIRTVDLPPKYSLDLRLFATDIQDIPDVIPPGESAPKVAVLDTGIASGHPLLNNAVQETRSFIPGLGAADGHGHGTLVSGIALYGDIEEAIRSQRFVPELRLYSGRILDDSGACPTHLIENHIETAVRAFHTEYGCKIFNLSFGDLNKPYLGGHVRGLAYVLDSLSRELGTLFIVSSGNVLAGEQDGATWRSGYPGYLTNQTWRLIDPAPALNALVVGSVARYDQSTNSRRYTGDPAEVPIARCDQPSPFTRCGPSVGGAIKPDLVAYGGNWALNTRAGADIIVHSGLGELSMSRDFASGRLFGVDCGTSLAAPHITHLAGRLLAEYPDASANSVRSLLLAHANIPEMSVRTFSNKDELYSVCGYGKVDSTCLFRSSENIVTLVADALITDGRNHFYEVIIPDDFVSSGRRDREISIALAYTPLVRSTRVAYKATRIEFRLVAAQSLEYVSQMFNRATSTDDYQRISELSGAAVGAALRSKGTVQADTWHFRSITQRSTLLTKKLFVVVTRNDYPWGTNLTSTEEGYSLSVCLSDRSNNEARMYTQLRQRLQPRGRARV
jgi:hypothetical protein